MFVLRGDRGSWSGRSVQSWYSKKELLIAINNSRVGTTMELTLRMIPRRPERAECCFVAMFLSLVGTVWEKGFRRGVSDCSAARDNDKLVDEKSVSVLTIHVVVMFAQQAFNTSNLFYELVSSEMS